MFVRTQVRHDFKCLDVFMNTYNSNPSADVSSTSQQPYFNRGRSLYTDLWQANAIEDAMYAAERVLDAMHTGSASECSFSAMVATCGHLVHYYS
jgi:hypothetical protein